MLLGGGPQGVDVPARDAVLLRDPLSCRELVGHVPGPVVTTGSTGAAVDVGTQRDPTHGLDTAGNAHVDGPGLDEPGDEVVGLLRGPALTIDRGAGDLIGKPGPEPGVAGDVSPLFAGLGDAPAYHLLHLGRLDSGPLHDLGLHGGEDLGGVQSRQPTVPLADRRPDRFDDDGFRHGEGPLWTCVDLDDSGSGRAPAGVPDRVGQRPSERTSITVRMTFPAFMSSKALFTSLSDSFWVIIPSRSSRPARHRRSRRLKSSRTLADP